MTQLDAAASLVALCRARNLIVTTAESCTGGLIAAAITDIPGSSIIFTHGFVTYSNEAKSEMLGVPESYFGTAGAVSEDVVREMATGARRRAGADLAIAVTGIAGPDGGSEIKPVGTVWFGLAGPQRKIITHLCVFSGTRAEIRSASVNFALNLLCAAAGDQI